MPIFNLMFNILPLLMLFAVILVIISFSIKNKQLQNILFVVGFVVIYVYFFTLFGIVAPYYFISATFKDIKGIILIAFVIFAVWAVISLFIQLKNNSMFAKNNGKDIYIRDITVKYSPAVLSYLMNNKIETKKDLSATILNLCAKNILQIQKDNNGKIKILDLENQVEAEQLSADEKYAYEMLVSGVTNSKINTWKSKVKKEYKKYRFSKENKKILGHYILGAYFVIFIAIFIYSLIALKLGIEVNSTFLEYAFYVMIATFFAAWEVGVLSSFSMISKALLNKGNTNEFKDYYTKKGAKEYMKWKKFEKFMEEFSMIEEREHESIVIWGKYLSYSIALGINKKCDTELFKTIDKELSFDIDTCIKMLDEC